MPRPHGQNVTEVELGSSDYTVVPLNAREKRLLKTPSAEHYHRLLLEAISSARHVFKDIKRTDESSWNNAPYLISLGYGWTRARAANVFLSLSTYKVRLSERGTVVLVEFEHESMKPPDLVDYLMVSQKVHFDDTDRIMRVLSTVSVQLEKAGGRVPAARGSEDCKPSLPARPAPLGAKADVIRDEGRACTSALTVSGRRSSSTPPRAHRGRRSRPLTVCKATWSGGARRKLRAPRCTTGRAGDGAGPEVAITC